MKNFLPVIVGCVIVAVTGIIVMRYDNSREGAFSEIIEAIPTPPNAPDTILAATPTPSPLAVGISLRILSPAGNATVSEPAVIVKGVSVAGAEIFVNDSEAKADAGGNFSVSVPLDEGENYILVVANDAIGNYSEKELFVTYAP